jgi:hypothetical protein
VRKILFSRFDALVRGARVSDTFARLFRCQGLEEFKLAQAESAARFALRHNGQEPAERLLGATRALAATITALVAERAERDKLERAVEKLIADAAAKSINLAAARHAFGLLGWERRDDERRFLWSGVCGSRNHSNWIRRSTRCRRRGQVDRSRRSPSRFRPARLRATTIAASSGPVCVVPQTIPIRRSTRCRRRGHVDRSRRSPSRFRPARLRATTIAASSGRVGLFHSQLDWIDRSITVREGVYGRES